jgi:hypothetical protein
VNTKALIEALEHSDLGQEAKAKLREILSPEKPVAGWTPALTLPPEVSARIQALEVSDETKKALKAVALGVPIPEAARFSGCKDTLALFQFAVGLELISLEAKDLIRGQRRNALLASEEIGKRLIEKPEDMSPMELNAIGGTAIDKVRDFEGWRSVGARGADDGGIAAVLEKLDKALEGKSISLKVEPTPPDRQAIDVIPRGTN